ncbi:nucleotidyltransferase domain-containing protein [Caldithrix abyssi]|nr:nucleotidyltransferase domain-containing protein [Caldithrix abyssi]
MEIDEILIQIKSIVGTYVQVDYRLELFGSRANGECDPKADLDIGILVDNPIESKTLITIWENQKL